MSRRTQEGARLARRVTWLLMVWARTGLFCCVFIASWPEPARAAELTLDWSAPSGCPSQTDVSLRLTRQLVESGVAAHHRQPHVRGHVVRRGGVFVLSLAVEMGSVLVARELRSTDCDVLSTSAAVLVALAIAPELHESPREELPSASPQVMQTAARMEDNDRTTARLPTPPSPAQKPKPRPVASTSTLSASVWAALGAGLYGNGLPGPRPDLSGELGFDAGAYSAGLRLGHVFARTRTLTDEASTRLYSDFLALTGCGRWGAPRVAAGPCVSLSGTRIHGSSRGLVGAQDRSALWAQLGLGAQLHVLVLQPVSLRLAAGMLLPLSPRPRFEVDASGAFDQGTTVSGYAESALLLRFD